MHPGFVFHSLNVPFLGQGSEVNKTLAHKRYHQVISTVQDELMVSGSDDFTMFLWNPGKEKQSIARQENEKFS